MAPKDVRPGLQCWFHRRESWTYDTSIQCECAELIQTSGCRARVLAFNRIAEYRLSLAESYAGGGKMLGDTAYLVVVS